MSKWKMVELCNLGEIVTGNTPKTSEAENYESNDIPFLKPSDFDSDSIDLSETEFYISEKAKNKARILSCGSVAVTCIGIIGKVKIVNKECAFNQQINAIIPNNQHPNRYIAYAILFQKNILQHKANSSVVSIINKTDFSKIQVPLPPFEIQHQIAENLDKVTHLIDLCNSILDRLDLLVKSRFVEIFGDPIDNPKKWTIKKLEEVAILNKGVTYAPEDVANEGLIVLRSSNIKGNEFDLQDLVKITKKISSDKYVQENDILMCNRNGSARLVGKVAKIPKLDENMTFGTFMTIVRSDIYEYLYIFFQLDAFRKQIKFQTAVAINQISLPLLASVKVPIPPTNLIKEFTIFVEQIDKSKLAVKKVLEKAETLKKALMQEYFG